MLLLFLVVVVEVDVCTFVGHMPDKHILNDSGSLCFNQSTESYTQGEQCYVFRQRTSEF